MFKPQGKRALCVDIPAKLYMEFAKLCVGQEITKTTAIMRCIKYLLSNPEILNEHAQTNSKLDRRKS